MPDRPDDDDIWSLFEPPDDPAPHQQPRPRTVPPVTHKVLLPGGAVVFAFGTMTQPDELLPVPMISLRSTIVAILPMSCIIEKWCGGEGWGRDWCLVHAPPPGVDTSWVADHPGWAAA